MTTAKELSDLVEAARAKGAIIRTRHDGWIDDPIEAVQVRYGSIAGVGDDWMPAIQAAERLREFVYAEAK